MSRKAKVKSRPATKLKGKLHARKMAKRKPKSHKALVTKAKSSGKKIVRIMGHGQYAVDIRTLKKLSDIDTAIVELVRTERSDDFEFKKKLTELNDIVVKNGKPVDSREIIKSDIILPSADLSIDEAKRLFRGEGVIPEV
jgi:hypothetical protein